MIVVIKKVYMIVVIVDPSRAKNVSNPKSSTGSLVASLYPHFSSVLAEGHSTTSLSFQLLCFGVSGQEQGFNWMVANFIKREFGAVNPKNFSFVFIIYFLIYRKNTFYNLI